MSFVVCWSSQQTRFVRPEFMANAIFKRRYVLVRRSWRKQQKPLPPAPHHQPHETTRLFFSSVISIPPLPPPSPLAASSTSSSNSSSSNNNNNKSNNNSNVFLDHLGTIFLGGICTVIVWLVRSYWNGQARNAVREAIEQAAHIDPIEIDDLRTANNTPELDVDLFLEIYTHVVAEVLSSSTSTLSEQQQQQQSTPEIRYDQFVGLVREVIARKLGTAAFTVQLGHLLDRVATAALEKRRDDKSSATTSMLTTTTMPIRFWFTLLSLVLSSPPRERIDALHAVLSQHQHQPQQVVDGTTVQLQPQQPSLQDVIELVGYLQDTCQLVPDAQVVATTHQYPLQQYAIASPDQLVDRYRVQYKIDPEQLDTVDNERLYQMLTSNSICVWGECYKKKKSPPQKQQQRPSDPKEEDV